MSRTRVLCAALSALVGLGALAPVAAAQDWFELPDPFERPVCMSRNGSGVVYGEYPLDGGARPGVGRWSQATGLELVDPFDFTGNSTVLACSENGSSVIIQAEEGVDSRTFVANRNGSSYWLAPYGFGTKGYGASFNGKIVTGASAGGPYGIYTPSYWVNGVRRSIIYPTAGDLYDGYATGCSFNGDVIVGQAIITYEEGYEVVGFRYDVSENKLLRLRKSGLDVNPIGCTRNGKVTFGFTYSNVTGDSIAATWAQDGAFRSLGRVRQRISFATLASNSGSVIAGWAGNGRPMDDNYLRRGYVWTASRGAVDIGDLGSDIAEPKAMSTNGKIVVGNAIDGHRQEVAYIWTRETGIHPLVDVLRLTLKKPLKGYFIRNVADISLNGRQMCLYVGKPNKSRGAVFVTLPSKLIFPRGQSAYLDGNLDTSAALSASERNVQNPEGDRSSAALSACAYARAAYAASSAAEYAAGDEGEEGEEALLLRNYERALLRSATEQSALSFVELPGDANYEACLYAIHGTADVDR